MGGPPAEDFLSHEFFGPAAIVILFLQIAIVALLTWLILTRKDSVKEKPQKQEPEFDYYQKNFGRKRDWQTYSK